MHEHFWLVRQMLQVPYSFHLVSLSMKGLRGIFHKRSEQGALEAVASVLRSNSVPAVSIRFADTSGNFGNGVIVDGQRLETDLARLSSESSLSAKVQFLQQVADAVQARVYQVSLPELLLVRADAASASAEVERRSLSRVGALMGRLLATDLERVETFLDGIATHPQVSELHRAAYHGIVLGLLSTDAQLAIEIAANASLPPLNGSVASALAKTVSLQSGFDELLRVAAMLVEKDEAISSSQTVATALAVRLRALTWDTEAPLFMRDAAQKQLLRLSCDYRVDPSVAYASNTLALQRWVSRATSHCESLSARATGVTCLLTARHASLRHNTADAASLVCMSDVESAWLRSVAPLILCEQSSSLSDRILRQGVLRTVLEDPKRWLVDARLLREYGALLASCDISCTDTSFAPFLEECGECHRGEQPEEVAFDFCAPAHADTEKDGADGMRCQEALMALAPLCSYWVTLLRHLWTTHVNIVPVLPGVLRVRVVLPRQHECLAAARSQDCVTLTPVFEDDSMLVLNKAAFVPVSRHALCHTQSGDSSLTDLVSCLLSSRSFANQPDLFRGGMVHRLDTETSGVVVFAKTPAAMSSLRHQVGTSAQFGAFSKVYHALVVVLRDLGTMDACGYIHDGQDPRIVTRYSVVKVFPRCRVALVECRIQQGKKHQIRRHLARSGMPIVQDVEYGGAACCTALMERIALHASSLTFVHPISQKVMCVQAGLPSDMTMALETLVQSER